MPLRRLRSVVKTARCAAHKSKWIPFQENGYDWAETPTAGASHAGCRREAGYGNHTRELQLYRRHRRAAGTLHRLAGDGAQGGHGAIAAIWNDDASREAAARCLQARYPWICIWRTCTDR